MLKDLKEARLKNIVHNYRHPSWYLEKRLLDAVACCRGGEAKKIMDEVNVLERATLSTNPLRSKKNSLIAWCTLFTRAVLNVGVDYEDAFTLSDMFILQIEESYSLREIEGFEYEMIEDFIVLIQKSELSEYKYPVSKVVRYIRMNVMESISVSSLAVTFKMHPDYLSNIFHDEVGVTLTRFIQSEKMTLARNYLTYTDMSITEISHILGFSTSGYFARVFRGHMNETPSEFRMSRAN